MSRLANQIVSVCAYLSNFHPALVPVASYAESPVSVLCTHSSSEDQTLDISLSDNSDDDMDSDISSLCSVI